MRPRPLCDIYQCKRGHLICKDCHGKLTKPISCPSCRVPMINTPIRSRAAEYAIQDLELPCKFAEKGCKYVAARSTLREHIQACPFDLRVECQDWICKEMMSMGKLVDHLQEDHGCETWREEIETLVDYTKILSSGSFYPSIVMSMGNTFFLNVRIEQNNWKFWVVILGTEDDAKNYEVVLSIRDPDNQRTPGVELSGKVFGSEERQEDVIKREGVVHLDEAIAENVFSRSTMGELVLSVLYRIIRK